MRENFMSGSMRGGWEGLMAEPVAYSTSSPTASRPSATPIASACWSTAESWSSAHTSS